MFRVSIVVFSSVFLLSRKTHTFLRDRRRKHDALKKEKEKEKEKEREREEERGEKKKKKKKKKSLKRG